MTRENEMHSKIDLSAAKKKSKKKKNTNKKNTYYLRPSVANAAVIHLPPSLTHLHIVHR